MPTPRVPAPFEVTFIFISVLWLGLWNGLRLIWAFIFQDALSAYTLPGRSFYLALTGIFWVALAIILLASIAQRQKWARHALLVSAILYPLWLCLDRFLLQSPHTNNLFFLVALGILLGLFLGLLFSKTVREFFHD